MFPLWSRSSMTPGSGWDGQNKRVEALYPCGWMRSMSRPVMRVDAASGCGTQMSPMPTCSAGVASGPGTCVSRTGLRWVMYERSDHVGPMPHRVGPNADVHATRPQRPWSISGPDHHDRRRGAAQCPHGQGSHALALIGPDRWEWSSLRGRFIDPSDARCLGRPRPTLDLRWSPSMA